jgi:subtilisin family serine protease
VHSPERPSVGARLHSAAAPCTLALLLLATTAEALGAPPTPRLDRLLVRAKSTNRLVAEGASPVQAATRRAAALRSLGRPISRIEQLDVSVVRPPANVEPLAYARQLAARGDFELVQFDLEVRAVRGATTPNDPLYPTQWHLATIGAPVAWSITTGDPSVVVAVCDSGIDLDHPDLAPLLVPGYNAVDHLAQTSGGQVDGLTDHGTEVAGCVAAATDNGAGIAGLGWNLRLMPVRVSNQANDTANLSDIVNGVLWAVDHGALVVNVSFSGVETSFASEAGAYARTHGATLAWAAGNAASSLGAIDPPNVLVVGATDQNDALASFSNVGPCIDLVAPGVAIATTKLGGYSAPNGTSFATPIVAGAVALVRTANPLLSAAAAEFAVTSSTTDLGAPGEDPTFGAGRLHVGNAVALAVDAANQPLAPVALPDSAWRLTGSGAANVPVLSNDIDLNGPTLTLTSFDATSARGGSVTQLPGTPPSVSYLAPNCLEGPDTFHYTIADPTGLTDEGVVTVSSVRAPTFQPPIVASAPGFGVPESLEGSDLDLDGDTDLVAVYSSTPSDVVIFGRGPSGFAMTAQLDITADVQQLRIGQVAGSSRPDLVAVDMVVGTLVVATGLPTGGFGTAVTTSVPFPQALAVAVRGQGGTSPLFLNGDAAPDLFVSTTGFPIVIKAMFGDGNGGFIDGPTLATPGPATLMELADMNGDGAPELVAVIGGIGLVHIYTIGVNGQLTLLTSRSTGSTPIDLALGDIDGDGDLDVAVQGSGVLGTIPGVRLLRNAGNGQLGPAELVPASGSFPFSAVLADLDGDGDTDLAESNLLSNSIGVHPGYATESGVGAASQIAPIAATLNTTNGAVDLVALDDNGDGLTDLAALVTAGTGYAVRIYRALSSLPPESVADLNHDGVIGAGDLAILLGAWGTTSGDLDGDGTTGASDLAILLGWWGEPSC